MNEAVALAMSRFASVEGTIIVIGLISLMSVVTLRESADRLDTEAATVLVDVAAHFVRSERCAKRVA